MNAREIELTEITNSLGRDKSGQKNWEYEVETRVSRHGFRNVGWAGVHTLRKRETTNCMETKSAHRYVLNLYYLLMC